MLRRIYVVRSRSEGVAVSIRACVRAFVPYAMRACFCATYVTRLTEVQTNRSLLLLPLHHPVQVLNASRSAVSSDSLRALVVGGGVQALTCLDLSGCAGVTNDGCAWLNQASA
jgi:hypothetical protein